MWGKEVPGIKPWKGQAYGCVPLSTWLPSERKVKPVSGPCSALDEGAVSCDGRVLHHIDDVGCLFVGGDEV